MIRGAFVSFLFLVNFAIQARAIPVKTLIVTDIDDTLKTVHVLNHYDAATRVFRTKDRFFGMNQLLFDVLGSIESPQLAYLTNAPRWLLEETHHEFLRLGNFPKGSYWPRESFSQDKHKINTLRALIAEVKPERVILIGDNGEEDADIYQQIVNENLGSNIRFHQFIRLVYSSDKGKEVGRRLYADQVGFVSPLEIAFSLYGQGLMSEAAVQSLLFDVTQHVVNESSLWSTDLVFPKFVRCSDYRWQWDDLMGFSGLVGIYRDQVALACQTRSVLDFLLNQSKDAPAQ